MRRGGEESRRGTARGCAAPTSAAPASTVPAPTARVCAAPTSAAPTARRRGNGRGIGAARASGERSELLQQGSVTAEVAVVLPVLVFLLALLIGTAHVGATQLRLEEAARAGARELMRGESSESVQETVQRLAGTATSARIVSGAGWTTVEVRARVDGPLVDLLDIELHASASGKREHRE
jgi:hypothetical protein